MNDRILKLANQIDSLKQELQEALQEQEQQIRYRVKGTRVEFEEKLRLAHRQLKIGILPWLKSSQRRNVLSAPIIYSMIVPALLLDLALTFYQHSCFRLYRIPRVKRADYLVIDRYQLGYLNLIQKINCCYCAYVNGLIHYAREIAARTEQYWCPIKHARKPATTHARYLYFAPYGDAEAFGRDKQEAYRQAMRKGDIPVIDLLAEEPADRG
ncbi:hypothetical protein [Marinobacterium arenosum]|uniref:hypothetical protein n=1 Tax=Marinobacterium arenosum TaxID=2862496 RepID=UPI001C951856|nr:hypothetical protein [Marinobacterium arenosum]MBY4678586.1 hypothetical protein [Marinobacterium arenosum]